MRSGLTLAAGMLAGLWMDTMRRTANAESAHPPLGSFVDAGGVCLHVLERGRGTPVVLVHGAGLLSDDMALALLDRAGAAWHTIAVDRPGHGYSDRPRGAASPRAQARLLHDALVAMNVRKPVIVGHSLGGAVALAYALEFPYETGGLVFLGGYAYPTPRPDFALFAAPAVPGVGQVLSRTVLQPVDRLMLPGLIERIFAPNPVPDYYRLMPTELMLRPVQIESSAADLAALIPATTEMAPRYGGIRCPVAILAGEEDRIVDPADHAVRLHHDIPGSTLHLLSSTGHMLHHVRPDAVIAAIERIVRAAGIDAVHEQEYGR
ncbi:alpha/beta fold hydrolase [Azospirillum halopraeferens]|uniref:alpha/beta fold hydrolase n=1 Tax=Azospirillum halopraeferens TaxID=34010 RepID=UPI00041B7908|nr:alpha/beta hydrolase [Azospirillum halopraeferens]